MNEEELRNMMYTAQLPGAGTYVIRYPRGRGSMAEWKTPFKELKAGKGRMLSRGKDLAIISIGNIGNTVTKAEAILKGKGISASHVDMRFLKPLDEELLHDIFKEHSKIITVEDGTVVGGLGSAVLEFMADHNYEARVHRLGVPDRFIGQGSVEELQKECGFDVDGIVAAAGNLGL
jgi:1-deoxy-D-xylulose-5-phosphate synthase